MNILQTLRLEFQKFRIMEILNFHPCVLQASTFSQVMNEDSDASEEKAITALGILNTMETILTVMEEQKEVSL